MMNNGCITNLPDECVVEVPGYVDRLGVHIPKIGELPLGCAAVCSQSIWVQRLAVEAAYAGDRKLLVQAMMMDPLTGAVCNPPEIEQMVDEYLIEEEQWLPQYREEIAAAKIRVALAKENGLGFPPKKGIKERLVSMRKQWRKCGQTRKLLAKTQPMRIRRALPQSNKAICTPGWFPVWGFPFLGYSIGSLCYNKGGTLLW